MNKGRIKVTCAFCGKEEFVVPSRARKYLTCSVACLGKYNSERYSLKVEKTCPVCGKVFYVKKSHANKRLCCSKDCYHSLLPQKLLGAGNPNYKGRTCNADGYKFSSNHKFTEHRDTIKRILGINEIPKSLIVHHKDGDKHSNDPKNLILLTHSIHTWIHKNIGNYVFRAISEGKISVDEVVSWVDNERDKEIVKYVLTTDCAQQSVVLKQGELLGSPIDG